MKKKNIIRNVLMLIEAIQIKTIKKLIITSIFRCWPIQMKYLHLKTRVQKCFFFQFCFYLSKLSIISFQNQAHFTAAKIGDS